MANKYIRDLSTTTNPSLTGHTIFDNGTTTYKTTLETLKDIIVDGESHTFEGDQTINGNLIVTGSITAKEFIVSSSVTHVTTLAQSGSTSFGDSLNDNHRMTGSLLVTGSLNVQGGGAVRQFLFVSGFQVIGTPTHHTWGDPEVLHVGSLNSYNIAHFQGNKNDYSQLNVININSGSDASGDIVVTADNGSQDNFYVNLGINSSTYDAGEVGYASDGYLINKGNDLYIGSEGAVDGHNHVHIFSKGNWQTPAISVMDGNVVGFSTLSVTEGYKAEFSGSVKFNNQIDVNESVISKNLIIKNVEDSTVTIISGSGNIYTNPSTSSTGMTRHMSSHNTFIGDQTIPQISDNMEFSPNISYNIGATQGGSFNFYGPDSTSSSWNVFSNLIMGGQGVNFGTPSLPMNKISGSVQISSNIMNNGTLNVEGYDTNLNGPYNITGNVINGGLVNLKSHSGSLNFNSNNVNALVNVTNLYNPISGSTITSLSPRVNYNMLYGNYHNIIFSGSNTNTGQTKSFIWNLIQGEFITASIGDGDNSNIVDTAIIGNSLVVSGSSTVVNSNANYTPDNTHGSAFFGRFNSIDGNKAKTAETIFAVGTGTESNRKTGFLIDSGSNVHVDGSLNVTGNTIINGSLIIEGVSEVVTVDGGFSGNRDFNYTSGSIFYVTGVTGNGTWNVTNVPTTNNIALTLTYVIEQGVTPYSGSQYQINGSNVTVKWSDSIIPTGSANKTDIIGLTAFRVGSSWNVIGSLSSFGY